MSRKRKLPDGMVARPGRRGYYADFRIGGRRVQKKLGTDFQAAKSILNELKARAERAEFGLLDNDYAIDDLRDAFLKRCEQELRPGSVLRYRISLRLILDWLGIRKVSQIDTPRVLAYREQRLQRTGPRTVNHHVSTLNTMLAWGVRQKLIGTNPLKGIKPLLLGHLKEGRALTDNEIERLLQVGRPIWRDIWYALLVTGMRRDELANLRFSDIDWEARELIVRGYQAKNRRERRIPIDDHLLEILKGQAAGAPNRQPGVGHTPKSTGRIRELFTREHVFVTRQNTPLANKAMLYRVFLRCCKRADIQVRTYDAEGRVLEHVDIHSLRRTFATNAIVNGADPKSVQEILGHRTLDMTMRIYAKVKGASKRLTIGKLSYSKGATPPDHLLPMTAVGG